MNLKIKQLFVFLIILTSTIYTQQIPERKEIPDKYKWNLTDLYKNESEWRSHKEKIQSQINQISSFKGRLGESASALYDALSLNYNATKGFYKLYSYASMLSDEDLNVAKNQALNQEVQTLATKFSEATAFISPEILKVGEEKINKFLAEKKELAEFKMPLDNILRLKDHTLSEREEEILAGVSAITMVPGELYSIFANSEMPIVKVTLSDGSEVEVNSATFPRYRLSPNRADRQKVFKTFFENYKNFQNTIGTNLAGKYKGDHFYAKNRNYKSTLENSLSNNNIPVSVYENLISQINKNLPTLHKYLDLKKKMLGLDTLHYYDLYVPLVKQMNLEFSLDEGQKLILQSLKPMGNEYVSVVQTAFNDRWIDYMPSKGKRSGAYSNGAPYDEHPYMLMNYTDDYNSVSTLTHELGHTLHSFLSNKNQPFATSDYSIFVAEIASTFNENLLNDYMVKNAKTDEERLFLLGSYLENLRSTIFRQTMFAEFELEAHKLIEKEQPVTGETLSELYYNIVKKYYGHDKGVSVVDPYIAYEWAYIPHFFNYNYYVYQYSTSLIFSTAFSQKVLNEGKPALDNYYKLLKGGASEYPIDLIKKAGVDPLSSEAFELTMKRMNDVMNEIEKIISKKSNL